MRNLFIMAQLMVQVVEESNTGDSLCYNNKVKVMLQVKNYSHYLTIQLSEAAHRDYLIRVLSECGTVELFQIIGGCIAGCLSIKIPVISAQLNSSYLWIALENMQK